MLPFVVRASAFFPFSKKTTLLSSIHKLRIFAISEPLEVVSVSDELVEARVSDCIAHDWIFKVDCILFHGSTELVHEDNKRDNKIVDKIYFIEKN